MVVVIVILMLVEAMVTHMVMVILMLIKIPVNITRLLKTKEIRIMMVSQNDSVEG